MENLSVSEAAVLVGMDQETIRTDIKRKVISARKERGRLTFGWEELPVLSVIYGPDLRNSNNLRKWTFGSYRSLIEGSVKRKMLEGVWPKRKRRPDDEWRKIKSALSHVFETKNKQVLLSKSRWMLRVNESVVVDVKRGLDRISETVDRYARGLARIESDPEKLAGEPVFKDTRLAVRQIGAMYAGGDSAEDIIDNYPYLTQDDVEFAKLFYMANPSRGRPPKVETAREAPR